MYGTGRAFELLKTADSALTPAAPTERENLPPVEAIRFFTAENVSYPTKKSLAKKLFAIESSNLAKFLSIFRGFAEKYLKIGDSEACSTKCISVNTRDIALLFFPVF